MTVLGIADWDLSWWGLAAMVAAAAAGGLLRGFTGGVGATLVMMPVLAIFVGPREAVPIGVVLMVATTLQLVPTALPRTDWREAIPLAGAGMAAIPLGTYILFSVDETLMRRVVAALALLFAVALLAGWRHTGRRGVGMSAAAGATGGLLAGSVGMGGPPIFLYLMSGPADVATNRATIVVISSLTPLATIVALLVAGGFVPRVLVLSAVLLLPFAGCAWLGAHAFRRTDEARVRRISLWVMVALSLLVLVL